jgi:hypothetical protein
MRAGKYPLEICGCPLHLFYLTPRQISDPTALDFNLLTVARTQVRIDVIISFSCSEVMLLDRASLFTTGLPKAMHLIVILKPTIESSLRWLFVVITFLSKILNQVAFIAEILLPSNVESFSLKNLGDLPFDRVIPMLYLVSCILSRSTKI